MSEPEQSINDLAPNPLAAVLDYIVETIPKCDDPLECYALARAAERAYRRDWSQFEEGTPQEKAHYAERARVIGALVARLDEVLSSYRIGLHTQKNYLVTLYHAMPRSGFNSEHSGGGLDGRLAAVSGRLVARLGELTCVNGA